MTRRAARPGRPRRTPARPPGAQAATSAPLASSLDPPQPGRDALALSSAWRRCRRRVATARSGNRVGSCRWPVCSRRASLVGDLADLCPVRGVRPADQPPERPRPHRQQAFLHKKKKKKKKKKGDAGKWPARAVRGFCLGQQAVADPPSGTPGRQLAHQLGPESPAAAAGRGPRPAGSGRTSGPESLPTSAGSRPRAAGPDRPRWGRSQPMATAPAPLPFGFRPGVVRGEPGPRPAGSGSRHPPGWPPPMSRRAQPNLRSRRGRLQGLAPRDLRDPVGGELAQNVPR